MLLQTIRGLDGCPKSILSTSNVQEPRRSLITSLLVLARFKISFFETSFLPSCQTLHSRCQCKLNDWSSLSFNHSDIFYSGIFTGSKAIWSALDTRELPHGAPGKYCGQESKYLLPDWLKFKLIALFRLPPPLTTVPLFPSKISTEDVHRFNHRGRVRAVG
jgi:hypothetical protein